MLKKLLSGLLALTLILSMGTGAMAAYAWRMSKGTILFTGSGEIPYSSSWRQYQFLNATAIEVGEGLTSLPDSAFSGMEKVSRMTLASTITNIGSHAFKGCTSLTGLTLPASLTTLGEYAFQNCIVLKELTIPAGVTVIKRGTFAGCVMLEKVNFTGNMINIGAEAFRGCTRLSVFAVPQGIKRLYTQAFAYCTGLVQVYIPASVQQVDQQVFMECSALTDIYYGGSRAQWEAMDIEDELLNSGKVRVHYNAEAADLDQSVRATGEASLRFDDVLPEYWGYKSILTIAEHGLVSGVRQPDANGVGSFDPEGRVTLGQFLVVITRLVCPELRKDTPGHWAKGSYNAAVEAGILESNAFPGTDSSLDIPLTRQNMAYILANAARVQGEDFTAHPNARAAIKDLWKVEESRKQAVVECYSNGIISGFSDGSFVPDSIMTRAQMAVVVCRLAGWQSRAEVNFD